jgi:urease subunit gamma
LGHILPFQFYNNSFNKLTNNYFFMRLTPRETEKLLLHLAGELAAKRLKRGVKLNYPECTYISAQIMEEARDGRSVADLMSYGTTLLKRSQVMEGVPEMIHDVQIEVTFPTELNW